MFSLVNILCITAVVSVVMAGYPNILFDSYAGYRVEQGDMGTRSMEIHPNTTASECAKVRLLQYALLYIYKVVNNKL